MQPQIHTPQTRTYRVPADTLGVIKKKVQALRNRASRLGAAADFDVTYGAPFLHTMSMREAEAHGWRQGWGPAPTLRMVDVELDGLDSAVRLNGWRYLGKIQHLKTSETNLVTLRPHISAELHPPREWKHAKPTCDHCGHARHRNATHLVQHDNGEIKRVGATCLKSYVGQGTASGILRMAERVDDLLAELAGVGHKVDLSWCSFDASGWVPAALLVGYAIEHANKAGFRKSSSEDPTKVYAINACRARVDKNMCLLSEEIKQEALDMIAWARQLPEDTHSDYILNLRTSLETDRVEVRAAGIAVSVVSAYRREQDRKAAEADRTSKPSAWIGTVGHRFGGKGKKALPAFRATVVRRRGFVGRFGYTTIIVAQTASGNEVVSFCSGDVDDRAEEGAEVLVCGTVKRHDNDKRTNRKQTVLTRASFTPVAG